MADYILNIVSRWNMSNIDPPDIGWKGNENNGTGTGLVASTDIKNGIAGGKSVECDGSGEFITSANKVGITGDAEFSISAWINRNTFDAGGQAIAGFGDGNVALGAAFVCLDLNGDGSISLEFAGGKYARTAAGLIANNEWHHIVGVKSAGAINTTAEIFLDGDEITIATAVTDTPNILDEEFYIGRFEDVTALDFNGKIDEVILFDTALTEIQVKDLMKQQRAGKL
jgi:hypothetical protein